MRQTTLCIFVLGILCGTIWCQDFDSDFRMCTGMPRSQVAFAMAMGGDLQSAASTALQANKIPDDKQKEILQKLFSPTPTSLTQLNGRIDMILNAVPVALANQIRNQFNMAVASKIPAAQADNIVCSISLLSYREASDVFGKRVANQYGVVQITIRNTDSAHEFLLHQVDFSFGDTLDYYATRDRKIARGVAEKGQVFDPRNLTVRILEGIASVAGPVTNVFSNDAKLASSIFSTSFVPAVKSVFPDLTVQQIAKLDDMGFSAGASTMVIPKNGAISLVGFVPSDSFLVPKLSQYEQKLAAGDDSKQKDLRSCADFTNNLRMNRIKMSDTNVQDQASTCNALQAENREPITGPLSPSSLKDAKGKSTTKRVLTMGLVSSPKSIKDYDPAVVLLLQRDLHIMISGSHIQELSTQLAVTSVACSVPDPLVGTSSATCNLGGNNLKLISQGRLIDKTDSAFAVNSSNVQISKDDSTHAQLSFPGCSFSDANRLSHPFVLETSTATGAPQINPSEQSLNKPSIPTLTCTGSGTISCPVPKLAGGASVTGGNLTGKDGASHTLTLKSDALTGSGIGPDTYTATLQTSDGKSIQLCPPVVTK